MFLTDRHTKVKMPRKCQHNPLINRYCRREQAKFQNIKYILSLDSHLPTLSSSPR